jgi:hypothetical protein
MIWSLRIGTETKTLAEWGAFGVVLRRVNLAGDQLAFSVARRNFAAAPLCNYGDTVTLLRDGVVWFTGTNQTIPRTAEAAAQADTYTILSPWRWLAQNIFQQPWFGGTVYTSHILTVGNAGGNIRAVLDYAIASGAPLAYIPADLALLTVTPPTNEFTEKTCAQVIIENLNFAPDVVVYFNYTTSPNPTLRFQKRSTLLAADLRMASLDDPAKQPVAAVSIIPRPDLQIPAAKINIEVIEEIDGVQRLVPSVDIWPPGATGREDGAFNATLTIQGRSVSSLQGSILCEHIDVNDVEWWKRHVPGLDSSLVDVLAGPTSVERVNSSGVALPWVYPRELMQNGGGIAPWMGVNYQVEVIRARFLIETYSIDQVTGAPSPGPIRTEEREFSVELISTDAPFGVTNYSTTASSDSGDPVPVGLARHLYESLSELHYQAAIALVQPQCDGVVNLGYVVNLHGARAEYAAMRALVQEVTFDIDAGTTQVQCGPPRQLGLSDLLALMQRFRVRRRWTNPETQQTGELGGDGGGAQLPRVTGGANTSVGASIPEMFAVLADGNTVELNGKEGHVAISGLTPSSARLTAGQIELIHLDDRCEIKGASMTLDGATSKIELSGPGSVIIDAAAAAGHPMRIQAFRVCVGNETKSALFLCSDIF